MTPFELLRGDMVAQVDNHLGDSISVVLQNGTATTLIGFVTVAGGGPGVEGMDPMPRQVHVKLDRTPPNIAALPNGPADIRRLTVAAAPGLWKPAVDSIDDDGNAWIFDLQKARAL